MAFAGAIGGGFVAALFAMELAECEISKRRYVGAGLGVVTALVLGLLLDWRASSIALNGTVGALLGVLSDRWVKHI